MRFMLDKLLHKLRRQLFIVAMKQRCIRGNRDCIRLGTKYGGWLVPIGYLQAGDVAICAGAGEDISFDLELIRRFQCRVHTVDPTPRAISHFRKVSMGAQNDRPVPINNSPDHFYDLSDVDLKNLTFHEIGLWKEETILRFYAPDNPTHVSHSVQKLSTESDTYFEAPCVSIASLCHKIGIEHPRLVKLDIETAEYDVISSMLDDNIFPEILLVEFDEGYRPIKAGWEERIRACLGSLEEAGYQLIDFDKFNFCFIRKP